jgi:hypothetical protein
LLLHNTIKTLIEVLSVVDNRGTNVLKHCFVQ